MQITFTHSEGCYPDERYYTSIESPHLQCFTRVVKMAFKSYTSTKPRCTGLSKWSNLSLMKVFDSFIRILGFWSRRASLSAGENAFNFIRHFITARRAACKEMPTTVQRHSKYRNTDAFSDVKVRKIALHVKNGYYTVIYNFIHHQTMIANNEKKQTNKNNKLQTSRLR